MRVSHHAIKPTVEGCESRELLSAFAIHAPRVPAVKATADKVVQLEGTLSGGYSQSTINPDVGSALAINGSGQVAGFGKAYSTGSFQSVGFIAHGRAGGTLVLAGSKGTITLSLTGAEQQNGPTGLPESYTFKTVVGTGKFWKVHDRGTASLVLSPGSTTSGFGVVRQGTFSLVLKSYPVPLG